MLDIKCILHPTDFSENSANAFRIARALARDYMARLIVLHAAQLPVVGVAGIVPAPPTQIDRDALQAQLRQLQRPDSSVRMEYQLVEGDPAEQIIEAARQAGCDLIVMGTHGRTGLERLLMGSVSENVMRKATCPVLTVKSLPSRGLAEAATESARAGAGNEVEVASQGSFPSSDPPSWTPVTGVGQPR